jgi:hypothetical protein
VPVIPTDCDDREGDVTRLLPGLEPPMISHAPKVVPESL